MSEIDDIIARTVKAEGGYVNNPNDPGGATNWGITERVARANGYTGDMRALPVAKAIDIYRNEYLVKPGFDRVAAVSVPIAREMFDTGVNMGVSIPGPWLQRWLNAFNKQGVLYADLPITGNIRDLTIAALRTYLIKRGPGAEHVMVTALNCSQGARYLDLTEKREKNEEFTFGWLKGRVAE